MMINVKAFARFREAFGKEHLYIQTPHLRACLTIQNHSKNKTEQRFISKNKANLGDYLSCF